MNRRTKKKFYLIIAKINLKRVSLCCCYPCKLKREAHCGQYIVKAAATTTKNMLKHQAVLI